MKKNILLAFTLMAALSSCNDWLDKTPLSDITEENYFRTETDLQLFSNNFYNTILDKSPYDQQSDVYVQQELSDELLGGSNRIVPASGEDGPGLHCAMSIPCWETLISVRMKRLRSSIPHWPASSVPTSISTR